MEESISAPKKKYSPNNTATAISGGGGVVYGLGFISFGRPLLYTSYQNLFG